MSRAPVALLLALLAPTAAAAETRPDAAAPASFEPPPLDCPAGTELRRTRPPATPAVWCEERLGGTWVRHGPFVAYAADGHPQRAGVYVHGRPHGCWKQWGPGGAFERDEHYWYGRGGVAVPDLPPLCPPGSARVRRGWVDGRLQDECLALDAGGNPVQEGPTVVYEGAPRAGYRPACETFGGPAAAAGAAEPDPAAPPAWVREQTDYRGGERHGFHRVFNAAGGLEVEEPWRDGLREGTAHSWYTDGCLRDERELLRGGLHGWWRFYDAGWCARRSEPPPPRWEARFEHGQLLSRLGELAVFGEPCPEGTLPVTARDGRSEACELWKNSWPQRHGPYVEWDEAGGIRERGIYRDGEKVALWEGPPPPSPGVEGDGEAAGASAAGVLVAAGPLTFDGRPLPEWTGQPPDFWLRDENRGHAVAPEVRYEGGVVAIYGLPPGYYFMNVSVDAATGNGPTYPGDYEANERFHVVPGQVARLGLGLHRLLHLTRPVDNEAPIPGWDADCAEPPAFAAPIPFAWEGLGEGVLYRYRVVRLACEPFRVMETVAEGSTHATAVVLDLPRSVAGEAYYFEIAAFRGGRHLGGFMTHGEGGHGWDFRFRVH